MAATAPRCTRHPGVSAGWRCHACDALLCPGCAYVARAGGMEFPSCVRCRGPVEVIRIPRSQVDPYLARLGRALLYPLRWGSVLAIAGCAAVMVLLSYVPIVGWLLSFGISWSFLFAVIRQSARGETEFQPPEASDPWDAILLPALRGIIALAIVWVPGLVRAGMALASGDVDSLAGLAADPVLWVIVVACALYAPSALLHAAFGSVLGMLNPLQVVGSALRLGADYLWAVGGVVLVLGSNFVLDVLFPSAFGSFFFVSRFLQEATGLIAPTLAAHLLGLLLYVRGDTIELGPADDYLVPILGGATPRGAEPPALQVPPPSPPPEAIELEPASPDPSSEIARLVAAGDLGGAARLFEAHRAAPLTLTAAVLFEVGRGASQAGSHAVAAEALHRAAGAGDPAVAPQALLVLARILERRLARPADARRVYLHLLRHHPESDAARHAKVALGAA